MSSLHKLGECAAIAMTKSVCVCRSVKLLNDCEANAPTNRFLLAVQITLGKRLYSPAVALS